MNRLIVAIAATVLCGATAFAQPAAMAQKSASSQKFGDKAKREEITRKGVNFLLQKGQAEDGSFSKQLNPAITSLCLSSLLANDVAVTDERIQEGLAFVTSHIQDDGGIYKTGSTLKNYETSVAIMCLVRARDAYKKTKASEDLATKYDVTIEQAAGFLKGLQWDEGENHGPESEFFGGQGYGNGKRPDLSNAHFFLEALKAAGEPADSEAVRKAMVFVSRCQNLSSEHNEMEFAKKKTADGGFIYSPANGGESKVKTKRAKDESIDKADQEPNGGLRSYGSMTYAGLKSFLYAGVSKDDQRVRAAMSWISKHYDLSSNPGLGQQGVYYYYHVFGKTMDAVGEDEIADKDGTKHDWRKDLTGVLAKRQQPDGSWTNAENSARWYEGDPNLVTAYSLLALSYTK